MLLSEKEWMTLWPHFQTNSNLRTFIQSVLGLAVLLSWTWLNTPAVYGDTQVVAWGDNDNGQTDVPDGLTNIVFIAGGGSNSLAIKADGKVVVWGNNWHGQTNVPTTTTPTVSAALGQYHVLALRSTGRVRAWGWNDRGQTAVPSDLSNVVAIAAGGFHSLALTAEGKVVTWGDDYFGLLPVPEGLSNVVAIAAAVNQSWALKADGEVVGWGEQLPSVGLSNVVQITGTSGSEFAAVDSNGRIEFRGSEVYAEIPNKVAVTLGDVVFGLIALTGDGRVYGGNDYAPLPPNLTNVVMIAAGTHHGLALVDPDGLFTSWRLDQPVVTNDSFILTIPTQRGRSYVVESTASPSQGSWTIEKRLAGDGSQRRFSFPLQAQKFFRVRRY